MENDQRYFHPFLLLLGWKEELRKRCLKTYLSLLKLCNKCFKDFMMALKTIAGNSIDFEIVSKTVILTKGF